MYRRFLVRCGRLPLFRIGGALVVLSAMLEGLDALSGIDFASILPAGTNVPGILAVIGLIKIALRGAFVIASALETGGK
jgi:hypothetical protein